MYCGLCFSSNCWISNWSTWKYLKISYFNKNKLILSLIETNKRFRRDRVQDYWFLDLLSFQQVVIRLYQFTKNFNDIAGLFLELWVDVVLIWISTLSRFYRHCLKNYRSTNCIFSRWLFTRDPNKLNISLLSTFLQVPASSSNTFRPRKQYLTSKWNHLTIASCPHESKMFLGNKNGDWTEKLNYFSTADKNLLIFVMLLCPFNEWSWSSATQDSSRIHWQKEVLAESGFPGLNAASSRSTSATWWLNFPFADRHFQWFILVENTSVNYCVFLILPLVFYFRMRSSRDVHLPCLSWLSSSFHSRCRTCEPSQFYTHGLSGKLRPHRRYVT